MSRHYKTGEKVPLALLESRQNISDINSSLETQNQIQMAYLDQLYHSPLAMNDDFDSSAIHYSLAARISSIPIHSPAQWQVQFSHLFTYGASYYSYLWSRQWASRIHQKFFQDKDPKEWKTGGQLIRQELLQVGGGREPLIGLEKLES